MKTYTREEFKKKYGETGISALTQATKKLGVFSETVDDIKGIGSDIKTSFQDRMGKFREGNLYQKFGQSAGLVSDVIGAGFKGAVKTVLPQSAETAIKTGISSVAKPVMESEFAQKMIEGYKSLPEETRKNIDATLGLTNLALDLTGLGIGKKAVTAGGKQAIKGAKQVISSADDIAKQGVGLAKTATSKIIKTIEPKALTPKEAIGQVIQGTTKDIAPAIKTVAALDTRGIKTFKDFSEAISSKIGVLANQVNADLAVDTTKRLIKDLTLKAKTKSGKILQINPVDNALKQLDELYTSIGDVVESANIKELIETAGREGLTNLDINNIAKVYGKEFGEKAFNKLGDPLTSINAQMYENTRTALKTLARKGIKGAEAQKADKLMSSMYNTQNLVKRNLEAVNKIQQKIQTRGLAEKIGYNLSKYADVLTGGSLRGFVGGLLPRGAGYKVLNAIDIEKALSKNLDLLKKAIKSGDDKEIAKLLQGLPK